MLLNQTSGLVDYTTLPPPPGWMSTACPRTTILTLILAQPLVFTPGSAYQYSNSNYFILGAVIEAVTSVSYWDYLDRHVLRPAGLTHTGPTQSPLAASPYTYTHPAVPGTTGLAEGLIPDPSIFFSAGALWSTVADLAKWDAALRDGAIISRQAFHEMVTPPPSIPVFQDATVPTPYAMGWIAQSPGAVVPVLSGTRNAGQTSPGLHGIQQPATRKRIFSVGADQRRHPNRHIDAALSVHYRLDQRSLRVARRSACLRRRPALTQRGPQRLDQRGCRTAAQSGRAEAGSNGNEGRVNVVKGTRVLPQQSLS